MSRPYNIIGLKVGNYRIPKATHRLAKMTDRYSVFFGYIPAPALASSVFDLFLSSASPRHSKVQLQNMFLPMYRACQEVIVPVERRITAINQLLA